MERKRLVIALGGNALGNTPQEQLELVRSTASTIVDLVEGGYDVVVGHGNGPQVGMINLAMDFAAGNGANTPAMPFPECGAMSQGYIGYHLQQAIQRELKRRGISKECAALVTQVAVDPADPAFQKPTKPIGAFYSEAEAKARMAETGHTYVEDAGRGWRRVVPSPKPIKIVELGAVEALLSAGGVVITVGGGGVPVAETPDGYEGVAAVIDKDRACARLALDLHADMLVILTAVDRVCINWGKPDQAELAEMTAGQAKQYISEGHFAPGSMLPKVEACLDYVTARPGGQALITSLEKAGAALRGETGTVIRAS